MTSDESPRSLVDQAAAWVPPWARTPEQVPAYADDTAEVPADADSAEVPADADSAEVPADAESTEVPADAGPAEAPADSPEVSVASVPDADRGDLDATAPEDQDSGADRTAEPHFGDRDSDLAAALAGEPAALVPDQPLEAAGDTAHRDDRDSLADRAAGPDIRDQNSDLAPSAVGGGADVGDSNAAGASNGDAGRSAGDAGGSAGDAGRSVSDARLSGGDAGLAGEAVDGWAAGESARSVFDQPFEAAEDVAHRDDRDSLADRVAEPHIGDQNSDLARDTASVRADDRDAQVDDAQVDAAGSPALDVDDAPSPISADHAPGATPTDTAEIASVPDAELRGALEAILLVVDEPVTEIMLAQVLDQPTERVTTMLVSLVEEYSEADRGFELRRAAGGWRLYTRPRYAQYVEKFVLDGQQVRLTQAALETLAVVAYKQPVTRSRISAIRGVNCDGVVRTLIARGLIEECGSEPDSGAFLYRTTTLFLEKLGLDSVDQLPALAPFLPDDVDAIADAQR